MDAMDETVGELASQNEVSPKNVALASPGPLDGLAAGLMLAGLLAILWLGLLSAFLSGFFVYFLIQYGVHWLGKFGVIPRIGRIVLALAIAILLIGGLTIGIVALVSFLSSDQDNLGKLMQRMVEVVGSVKTYLPPWLSDRLPSTLADWQKALSGAMRGNAAHLTLLGRGAGALVIHILFGMIIGAFVAISPPASPNGPLAQGLEERIARLGQAFRGVVFSQIKISAVNTCLTAIFLGAVLPLAGRPLPFTKTMIAVTFVVGLLPIIGNLISNTIIVLVALGVTVFDAAMALAFLIGIHKLEYVLNAQIIGTEIRAHAWEILLAMLVLEAAFGLKGLIAAPIFYAYLKDDLKARRWV
jgi:predicted PurR-regulated permease PerM